MDPSSLAAAAIPVIVNYLSRSEKVGDAAVGLASDLYQRVRGWFTDDPTATGALDRLEEEPENPRRQGAAEFALASALDADPERVRQLGDLLRALESAGSGSAVGTISDAGVVSLSGDVTLKGTHVAGRDLTIDGT